MSKDNKMNLLLEYYQKSNSYVRNYGKSENSEEQEILSKEIDKLTETIDELLNKENVLLGGHSNEIPKELRKHKLDCNCNECLEHFD
ncbi:hypothetical protein LCGC14_2144460 [marine sediment metagenome]|uniref:Uncharacterized protein n=1 Tax=marine sediment metagenome TaxID=412755 RepID=A0A0F9DXR9_9ZZZZ